MTTNVSCFLQTCESCGKDTMMPILSDFDYGRFIYQTEDAQHFAIATAPGNTAWDLAKVILNEKGYCLSQNDEDVTTFPHTMIHCADALHGCDYTTKRLLCTHCLATIDKFDERRPTSSLSLPDVSWDDLLFLSPSKQKEYVLSCYDQSIPS